MPGQLKRQVDDRTIYSDKEDLYNDGRVESATVGDLSISESEIVITMLTVREKIACTTTVSFVCAAVNNEGCYACDPVPIQTVR